MSNHNFYGLPSQPITRPRSQAVGRHQNLPRLRYEKNRNSHAFKRIVDLILGRIGLRFSFPKDTEHNTLPVTEVED